MLGELEPVIGSERLISFGLQLAAPVGAVVAAHGHEIDSRQAGLPGHLLRKGVKLGRLVAAAEVLADVLRRPDEHCRSAVDPVVLLGLQVMVEPVLRHLPPVLERVRAGAIVVGPHHGPFQEVFVARLRIGLVQPVLELSVALRPVPVDYEERHPVLDGPFDLPIGALGIRLVVPAEHRLAHREIEDRRPAGGVLPAGKVECTNVDLAAHRPRLGHIAARFDLRRRGEIDGRLRLDRRKSLYFQLRLEPRRAGRVGADWPTHAFRQVGRNRGQGLDCRAESLDARRRFQPHAGAAGRLAAEIPRRQGELDRVARAVDALCFAEVGNLQFGRPAQVVGHFDRLDPHRRPNRVGRLQADKDHLALPPPQPAHVDVVGMHAPIGPEREGEVLPAELRAADGIDAAKRAGRNGHPHADKRLLPAVYLERRAEQNRPVAR